MTDLRSHQQLRHYVQAVGGDVVYYAAQKSVYAIHTPTRRRKRIASLQFEAWCLGVGYGWVCVGGQHNGRCAMIDLGSPAPFAPASQATNQEVDSALPLNLDRPSDAPPTTQLDDVNQRKSNRVYDMELGGSVINAITVHELRSDNKEETSDVVAIVA